MSSFQISTRENFDKGDHNEGFGKATHGYDPKYTSMGGIFVGHGPAFKQGIDGPGFSNIHIYEMMCKILNLTPATNDGSLDSIKVFLQKHFYCLAELVCLDMFVPKTPL